MNEQLKKLPLSQITEFAKRFRLVLFLSLFAGAYIFLLLHINALNSQKVPQNAIDAELQAVKRLNIDDESVQQMLKLTEENIEVKSLYEEARNNPFSE